MMLLCPNLASWADNSAPYHAMGEKAGEVTSQSVILMTRLTDSDNAGEKGEVPGKDGRVRFEYAVNTDFKESMFTPWITVNPEEDFIGKAKIESLSPATEYSYRVHIQDIEGADERIGPARHFKTAPELNDIRNVSFTVITGQKYMSRDDERGHKSYDAMLALKPDFIVPTGDNVYYDNDTPPKGVDEETCRLHWHRMYSHERQVNFYGQVAGYWEKDDHDFRWDDSDPITKADVAPTPELGIRIFLEQHPIEQPTYRTFRWGKGLQIWLTEGRDYRDPNSMPDGPDKSMWGKEQKEWLKQSILESNALFKVLISPTPLVGPDRVTKVDNHTNLKGYKTEGDEFFNWLTNNGIQNFYIGCGDRHWQYRSIHPSGYQEFSSGALSDGNLANVPPCPPEIKQPFAKSIGGFLHVQILAEGEHQEHPAIQFSFHDSDGNLNYRHDEKLIKEE